MLEASEILYHNKRICYLIQTNINLRNWLLIEYTENIDTYFSPHDFKRQRTEMFQTIGDIIRSIVICEKVVSLWSWKKKHENH